MHANDRSNLPIALVALTGWPIPAQPWQRCGAEPIRASRCGSSGPQGGVAAKSQPVARRRLRCATQYCRMRRTAQSHGVEPGRREGRACEALAARARAAAPALAVQSPYRFVTQGSCARGPSQACAGSRVAPSIAPHYDMLEHRSVRSLVASQQRYAAAAAGFACCCDHTARWRRWP